MTRLTFKELSLLRPGSLLSWQGHDTSAHWFEEPSVFLGLEPSPFGNRMVESMFVFHRGSVQRVVILAGAWSLLWNLVGLGPPSDLP